MKLFCLGIISILLFCFVVGCSKSKAQLDKSELDLAAKIGIPNTLLQKVKAESWNIRQFEREDDEDNPKKALGITIDVSQDKALAVAERIKKMTPPDFMVFISDRNYGIEGKPDSISILKASGFSEVIKVMGTNGWNYDISPEMIIKRVEAWDKRFGLKLIGAGFDWVEFEFINTPQDMMEFAKEVYGFCPDVVDQGTESVEALAREMKRTNTVYLWWD